MCLMLMMFSCSTSRKNVSLSEYQSMVDSVCKATGSKIYVDSFMYRYFPVHRVNIEYERKALLKAASDTCGLHIVERRYDAKVSPIWHKPGGTMAMASKEAWNSELMRRDKKNRVTWKEYVQIVRDSMPGSVPLKKREWKRQRMTRAELQAAVRRDRLYTNAMTGIYVLDRDSVGRKFKRRVTDSLELSRIKSNRSRLNSVANGMVGAAYSDKPYVGLIFGADGFKLSDTEYLWLKVYAGNCYLFPSSTPTCEVDEHKTYVKFKNPEGKDNTVYIKVRDPHFRLLQNPPFKYTFTANFQYDGRWYYVFLCDNPLKCVCKPIDVQQKGFPSF